MAPRKNKTVSPPTSDQDIFGRLLETLRLYSEACEVDKNFTTIIKVNSNESISVDVFNFSFDHEEHDRDPWNAYIEIQNYLIGVIDNAKRKQAQINAYNSVVEKARKVFSPEELQFLTFIDPHRTSWDSSYD